MKAVQIHQYGGPEALKVEDAQLPEIKADEVLVKVYAASVNPVDWKVRNGDMQAQGLSYSFPLILGWDMAGVVEKAGDEVTSFKAGDAVYGMPDMTRNGSYAEYVAVKASALALKPEKADFLTAAALTMAGLTAWQGIFDHGKLQPGQKILIHGGSGGVGTMAIQFAKWKHAYVATTASESNIQFLKDLGADEVIDYSKENFEEKLKDFDVVFDTLGGDTQIKSIRVLKPGGILVSTVGLVNPDAFKEKNIQGLDYHAQSLPEQLKTIGSLLDDGKIQPIVTRIFPLEEAVQAQELSEHGHARGKIMLEIVKAR